MPSTFAIPNSQAKGTALAPMESTLRWLSAKTARISSTSSVLSLGSMQGFVKHSAVLFKCEISALHHLITNDMCVHVHMCACAFVCMHLCVNVCMPMFVVENVHFHVCARM